MLYTIDGNDPRCPGGAVCASAQSGTDAATVIITTTTMVMARIKTEHAWSALRDLFVAVPQDASGLRITEIHYKPLDNGDTLGEKYEFIELKNTGTTVVNVSGFSFSSGISCTIAPGTSILPDSFFVLAADVAAFSARYGFSPDGEYQNHLSNSGETLTLLDPSGELVYSVTYSDAAPWPKDPDKTGKSLVPKFSNELQDQNIGTNWTASYMVHGSPRSDDQNSASAQIVMSQPVHQRQKVFRIGKYSVIVPSEHEFKVEILDLQGRTIKKFSERGSLTYQWVPKSKGLFFIVLKAVSGETVVRKVQVAE